MHARSGWQAIGYPAQPSAPVLGGTFEIEAEFGNGTTVKAAVPMQQKDKPRINADRRG